MNTTDITASLTTLFSELVDGANNPGGAFVLNSGDAGLLRSLDKLSAAEASDSVHGGATIAAHVVHTQYGLELLNRWAREGGNPFADAKWDEAWKTSKVSDEEWRRIRDDLRAGAERRDIQEGVTPQRWLFSPSSAPLSALCLLLAARG